VPHYTAWVNCLRGGLNGILAWVSLMVCIITHSVVWEEDEYGHPHWEQWGIRFTLTTVSRGVVSMQGHLGERLSGWGLQFGDHKAKVCMWFRRVW
jgi:hypothetical protein